MYGNCLKGDRVDNALKDLTNCTSCSMNTCQHDSTCQIVNGSSIDYTCQCKEGYSGAHCQFEGEERSSGKSIMGIGWIVLIVLVVLALIVSLSLFLYCRSKKREENVREKGPMLTK